MLATSHVHDPLHPTFGGGRTTGELRLKEGSQPENGTGVLVADKRY
jgi:hypothetical protein